MLSRSCSRCEKRSLLGAVHDFGADVDAFFYLTNDDAGDTSGGAPAAALSADALHLVLSPFRPKDVYYGPFDTPTPPYVAS